MTRVASIERKTAETQIKLSVNLDGSGKFTGKTSVGFLDHMLAHLAKHALIDLDVSASGDVEVDDHHTVEDVAICLGEAVTHALGKKAGIRRYGWACVPMDEALACTAVDLGGRASFVMNVPFTSGKIGTFDTQLIDEFLRRFATVAGLNLHVNVAYGANDHHMAEAVFKAVAMAFRMAKEIDQDRQGDVPSTKGTL
ncbi:MAG: imidazoleglycerol-phosphate dehydratase HisB [Planctomycetes bacterium]|nr:imidazoleglycerol-phosphate dehydratase HisB [Planctomycetota bacterium]